MFFLTFSLLSGCKSSSKNTNSSSAKDAAPASEIVVLGVTDFHAAFERGEQFAGALRQLQNRYRDRVVTVAAGDLFQGSVEGHESRGKAVIEYFNLLNVSAMALGSHDLDFGHHIFNERLRESNFPWLSVNIIKENGTAQNALGEKTWLLPHRILEIQGKKLAIIGANTEEVTFYTTPGAWNGYEFRPLNETINAEAHYLRNVKNCDFVILVIHAGNDPLQKEITDLLKKFPEKTLDGVIAGRTHQASLEIIRGTAVLQAPPQGKGVAILHLRKNQEPKMELFSSDHAQPRFVGSTRDVTEMLVHYRKKATKMKEKDLGKIAAPFLRNLSQESPLLRMVTRAFYQAGQHFSKKIDGAIVTNDSLNSDLHEGNIRYGHVYQALPWSGFLSVVKIKGESLRTLIGILMSGAHSIPGFENIKVTAYQVGSDPTGIWDRDLNGDGNKESWERNLVESIEINGEPLQDLKEYKIAMPSFLALGGDHTQWVFDKLDKSAVRIYHGSNNLDRDIVANFIKGFKEPLKPEQFYKEETRNILWKPSPASSSVN